MKLDAQFSRMDNIVTIFFNQTNQKDKTQMIRLNGVTEKDKWSGKGQLSDGTWIDWEIHFMKPLEKKEEKKGESRDTIPTIGKVIYPFAAYGHSESPGQETILIKNATIWTNEKDGILQNTDVQNAVFFICPNGCIFN